MTRAIRFRPSASSPGPRARFGTALAASAFAHWLLLSAPLLEVQWRGVAPGPESAPLTARLAPAPVRAPDIPVVPEPEVRRSSLPVQPPVGGFEGLPGGRSSSSGTAGASAEAPTLPGMPDPNYYPARELDDYPRPLTPLRIDLLSGSGEVRLEILIDERGVVQDVIFAGAAGPGSADEELRAMLAATRFLPALKDGRAVRSRVLLRLDPGIDSREP